MTTANTTTAIGPTEKRRNKIFRAMKPATQEKAKDFQQRLRVSAGVMVLSRYDIGAQILEMRQDAATYGHAAVAQIAEWLNIKGGDTQLCNLANIAKTFTREFVREWTERPMRDSGAFMEVDHWVHLQKLQDPAKQQELVERVIDHSWTANDLEREIKSQGEKLKNARHGGRKPAVPNSAIAGLQKTFQLAQQFENYLKAAEEEIFDKVATMPPDNVTPQLLKRLEDTQRKLVETRGRSDATLARVDSAISRVKTVLGARFDEGVAALEAAEGAEEEAAEGAEAELPLDGPDAQTEDDDEAEEEVEQPAKKAPPVNGKKGGKGGKKGGKKGKKPVAAS